MIDVLTLTAMPKYEAYKDSGVEWLGRLPSKWKIKKLKYLGVIYAGLGGKKGDDFSKEYKDGFSPFIPFTSISNSSIVANRFQFVSVKPSEVQVQVENNDILFLMSSETLEDIAKCALYRGEIQPLYLNSFCKGFRIPSANAQPDFINHLLQSDYYREYFAISARGFTRINLKQEFINNAPMALPSLPEQTAIAAFLDRKTAQIDQAVAIKEQQIALLKERKQILIQNAVTRGLDPNVPMKDSGVEWIGEIPAHWTVMRTKYLFNEVDERSKDGQEELLSVSHMTGVTPRSEKDVTMFMSENYTGSKTCKANDLVFNIMWAWMGALGVSEYKGIVSSSYGIFRQKKNGIFNSYYLESLLKSLKYIEHYNKVSTGLHSSRLRFYAHMFFNMEIGFPDKKEQDCIVVHILGESIRIDRAIDLQQQQIHKLKEYKTTLINSAVTGKIKVA